MTNGLRVFLYVALVLACIYTGWFGVDPYEGFDYVARYGLTAPLLSFGLFLFALFKVVNRRWHAFEMGRNAAAVVISLLVIAAFVASREPAQFKIVDDEILLSATAMNIHFNREIQVPSAGHVIEGSFRLIGGYLDKRPPFFSFLVAVLHDLTGYRLNNVFFLNAFLTFVLVGLIHGLARALAGAKAGFAAAVMMAGFRLPRRTPRAAASKFLTSSCCSQPWPWA